MVPQLLLSQDPALMLKFLAFQRGSRFQAFRQRNPSLQDLLTPPEEKQRWSVQSDQGYISRSSPQPPDNDNDNDNDNGEGVREEDEGQPLSSQGLESLRSLQLLLFS
ncbi:hypothetical protein R6Z07F_002960 [Ovis aries]